MSVPRRRVVKSGPGVGRSHTQAHRSTRINKRRSSAMAAVQDGLLVGWIQIGGGGRRSGVKAFPAPAAAIPRRSIQWDRRDVSSDHPALM